MGTGKTYSTRYLLDSNNNSGVAGQVLVTTATGVSWQDAESTGDNQTQGSLFDSKIILIDTPNGGLKPYRVITDEYGEWIQVGRFAANAMTTVQSTWSSVSGLSTGTSQSETTEFSADFGDCFPDEVRIMGATDFNNWRNTRTIDFVYKVPAGRKWKFFFSNGETTGMGTVDAVKYGWTVNGAYDGFGRWTNPDLVSIRMSDRTTPIINTSAAYTTPTANAFNWETNSDAKFSVSATRTFCGQDTFVTSGVGNDDNIQGFFDEYPGETNNMQGGADFSSAVWVLIKIPGGASGGGGDDSYWSANGNDIHNDNSGNVGIGTISPGLKLHVKNDNDYAAKFGGTGGGDYSIEIGQTGTNSSAGFNATGSNGSMLFKIADSEAMRINNAGNVGIGTTNPSFQLSIENHDTTTSTATMELDGKRTNGTDGPVGEMIFSNNGDTFATVAGFRDGSDNKGSLQFQTQDGTFTTKMTISSEGNVGIGMSPDSSVKLSVSGQIGTTNGTASEPTHTFYSDDDTGMFRAAANNLGFSTGGTERMRIDSDGLLKFSKTATTGTAVASINHASNNFLYINGGTEGVAIGDDNQNTRMVCYNDSYIRFDSAGVERMRLTPDGNSTFLILKAKPSTFNSKSFITLYGTNSNTYGGSVIARSSISSETDGTAYGSILKFFTNDTSNVEQNRLTILSNGSVGIGTTSPGSLLTLNGDGQANNYSGVLRIYNTYTNDPWGHIGLPDSLSSTTNSNNFYLIGRGNSYTDRVMSFHIPRDGDYGSGAQPKFGFYSTGSDLLHSIEAETGTSYFKGNVGVGTTNPASEANLSLAAKSTSEGGHLALFKGTSQTQATHLDNYANTFRIMNGADASSGAVQFSLNHTTAAATFAGNITTPTQELSTAATPTSFGTYTSEIRLIDTPNGGLKKCRVITDNYGEWILVGRFAADARANIQGTWSSESGLDTSTAQNNTTRFSADFGDSYPSEVRIMGATDFAKWRDTRTIDWVYGVPEGRKWKNFFSGGTNNGMALNAKYGWEINGAYDGFGRWVNPAQTFVRMSDANVTNPSAAYTTATTNAFNWNGASDAKMTVSSFRAYSGQDTVETAGFGADDNVQGFFDVYPSETNNMQGGTPFNSAVWVLIKLPTALSSGSGGGTGNQWAGGPDDIHNTNTGNVGIGIDDPLSKLQVDDTSDGDKIRWSRSGTLIGSLGTYNGVPYIGYQGGAGGGIMFNGSSIEPTALGNSRTSNANDVGSPNYKWRNGYFGNAVSAATYTAAAAEGLRINDSAAYISGYNTAGTQRTGYIQFLHASGTILIDSELGSRYTVMALASASAVGIGTSLPDEKLTVNGITRAVDPIYFGAQNTDNGTYGPFIESSDNKGLKFDYNGNNGGEFQVWNHDQNGGGALQVFNIDQDGKVRINTTSSSDRLNVKGALALWPSTGISPAIRLNPDSDSYINGGDLGVGNTLPQHKLDVTGTVRATNYRLAGNTANPTTTAATIYDQASVGLTLSAHNIELRNYNGSSMVRSVFFTHNSATFTGTCTATNFILSSDETLKDNIKDIDNKHIDVNWKNFELKSEPGIKRAGVIAQELEAKHPEFVRTNEDGLKSVAYVDLLIAKIAELEARLEKAGI